MAGEKKDAKKPAPAAKKAEKKKVGAYKPGKFCPKCGPGVKLANHKNRTSCGKCGYFEKK